MNCRRCGAPLQQGILVCPECGARQRRLARSVRCSHCHRRAAVELTLCPYCGRNLRSGGPLAAYWPAALALLALGALWFVARAPAQQAWQRIAGLEQRVVNLVQIPDVASLQNQGQEAARALTESVTPPTAEAIALRPASASGAPARPVTRTVALALTPLAAAERTGTPVAAAPAGSAAPAAVAAAAAAAAPSATAAPPTATVAPTAAPTATAVPPTATPVPPSPTPDVNKYYTVQPGDTLIDIGQATGVDWQQIAAINGITAATSLQVGQKLRLNNPQPGTGGSNTPVPAPAKATTYKVQAGDTLDSIGTRFGVPWQDVASANKLGPSAILQIGQELVIPGAGGPAPPAPPAPTARPPAPTAAATLPAPALLAPTNGTPFNGDRRFVGVRWNPVAGLPPAARYLLTIRYSSGGAPQEYTWLGSDTGAQVPPSLWGKADQPQRQYSWFVTVVLVTPDNQGEDKLTPLSPPSDTWNFTWQ